MKIIKKDKVMVITGRDKGKTGEVIAVLPEKNQVVVEGVKVYKTHTKPRWQTETKKIAPQGCKTKKT